MGSRLWRGCSDVDFSRAWVRNGKRRGGCVIVGTWTSGKR
jgi:hypothetical protein